MAESVALRAILRGHIGNGGRGRRRCPVCDPARAVYCWRVRDVAAAFALARWREVFAGRAVSGG